jgi:hypothetical protein
VSAGSDEDGASTGNREGKWSLAGVVSASGAIPGVSAGPERDGRRWIIVKVPQIDWIEADDNYASMLLT